MFDEPLIFRSQNSLLALDTPLVMGILNVTPDSFFESSRKLSISELIDSAGAMLESGAAILDIGAVSTRPGSVAPEASEESDRLLPAVESLVQHFPGVCLSIDTFRSSVAAAALTAGASIINDIAATISNPDILRICAQYHAPYIAMHMQGLPVNMQDSPVYENVTEEVFDFFTQKVHECKAEGVHDIWLDPGFGFGKTIDHNYTLLKNLHVLAIHQRPIVVGISRKGMIYRLLNISAEESLSASSALHLQALMNGATILRVHDVREARQMITIYSKLKGL